MKEIKGSDPYVSRQYLLHHIYSPLVSVESSPNSDILLQSILNTDSSILSILKSYGNNVKYPAPNQSFRITNTQLLTKTYPSFPVRFDFPLPELLSIKVASTVSHSTSQNNRLSRTISTSSTGSKASSKSVPAPSSSLQQLFSISSLESLLKSSPFDSNVDLYLEFFNKVITSNAIVPFDTFNHPISQVFIIDYNSDSIEYLRNKIADFRNCVFPKFFQLNDLLFHAFILYDENKTTLQEISEFENLVKTNLSIFCTFIPIISKTPSSETIKIDRSENSTIDEDLQQLGFKSDVHSFAVPKDVDQALRVGVNRFITSHLIPHMESKVRMWDDQILAPKKSITNRFFSVSKKFFNNNNNANESSSANTSSFNYQENYYHKSSPEQAIRKLADWSLILKDFKYSYSIYDFIKKDYNNDKAWIYVASTQEMCIISLLLVQTQVINHQTTPPDKNTLRKIRHDIIEPYLDNLSYTYKSRLNLKTYYLRTLLVVVELLACMCSTFNMYWWWLDLVEKYLIKAAQEFDTHLISSNHKSQVIKAIIYERLGYVFGKCSLESLVPVERSSHTATVGEKGDTEEETEGMFVNVKKLQPPTEFNYGLSRLRKSSIWYLISVKEWLDMEKHGHAKVLLNNMANVFDLESSDKWYDRQDLILGRIKKILKESEKKGVVPVKKVQADPEEPTEPTESDTVVQQESAVEPASEKDAFETKGAETTPIEDVEHEDTKSAAAIEEPATETEEPANATAT